MGAKKIKFNDDKSDPRNHWPYWLVFFLNDDQTGLIVGIYDLTKTTKSYVFSTKIEFGSLMAINEYLKATNKFNVRYLLSTSAIDRRYEKIGKLPAAFIKAMKLMAEKDADNIKKFKAHVVRTKSKK